MVELCTPIHISTHNTSSLHTNTPGSANAQILIIIYSHPGAPEGRGGDQGFVVQGTPQNTKSWPCWGREGSWDWYLWVCHCSLGLSDLLRRVETGKTKITRKGRSSFYQPKASPALGAAKGSIKLHPAWGLLHMTVPRQLWDSQAKINKILLGLSCSQAHAVPGSAGSPDTAASPALQ